MGRRRLAGWLRSPLGRVDEIEAHLHLDDSLPLEHGLPGTVEVEVERLSPAALVLRTAGVAGARGGRDILGFRVGVDTVPIPLVATDVDEQAPAVSPDGRHVSFLSGGDLWLLAPQTGALRQATQVGVPSIAAVPLGRYARPEVEVGPYVWGGPTYAWSPDSGKGW